MIFLSVFTDFLFYLFVFSSTICIMRFFDQYSLRIVSKQVCCLILFCVRLSVGR
jgi:hypothetical protein